MEQITKHPGTLNGKKIIFLGGSSGIGLAAAQAAAYEGAEIVIASSNHDRVDAALQQLPAGNKGYTLDLASEPAIKGFFDTQGTFDHLVYTAGENLQFGTLAETTLAVARSFFEVRYWGALAAVKYAAPCINTGGSIVLTGGAAHFRPGKGWLMGASITALMEGFTRALATDLAPVRVNIVVPGVVQTNLWDGMPEADREAMYVQMAGTLPVKYVAGAADIAQSYLHLMRQPYITGQRIVVDGGFSLG